MTGLPVARDPDGAGQGDLQPADRRARGWRSRASSCAAPCALVPLGLLVGSTARDIRTAPAIANLLFFPLMFLSGSAMPFAFLPEGVQALRAAAADHLPRRHLLERDRPRRRTARRSPDRSPCCSAIGVVGIVLTSMLFRWEGTDPIPRKALATIAIAFAATLGVSAFAAPAFRMADMPGTRRIEAGRRHGTGPRAARRHRSRRPRRPHRQRARRDPRSPDHRRVAGRRARAAA